MKINIQHEKSETICDITGKKKKEEIGWGNFYMWPLFFDKDEFEAVVEEEKSELEGKKLSEKRKRELKSYCYYDDISFDLDISPKICKEIYKFLKDKYPKQMKKFEKQNFIDGKELV